MATAAICRTARFVLAAGLALACAPVGLAQRSDPDPAQFIVILNAGRTDVSLTGVNSRDCALVLPDGRFHLERRYQRLPKSSATLRVYESSLSSVQLQRLRAILDDEGIMNLAPFVWPSTPAVGTKFEGFEARIARGSQLQQVGYFVEPEGTPERHLDPETEGVRKRWKEAEVTLGPLLQWFRGLEESESGLEPSGAAPTRCNPGGPP